MIKIYFGPYRRSPAPELPLDERRLWFQDFGILKGFEQDFWTNNPLILDIFEPGQVHVWQGDCGWVPLPRAADVLMPGWREDEHFYGLSTGRFAMACELVYRLRGRVAQDINAPKQ